MTKRKPQESDMIFALDIGTRSIIGIVGRVVDERFQVLAIEKEEHGKRAMLDGQIEDIAQVAKVARQVTGRLEQRLDCALERVCVAAAGRALRTETGSYTLEFPEITRITNDIIGRLESGAVSDAEDQIGQGQNSQRRFYLVGYTVSGYHLDHYPMTTLRGHNGQLLEATVVATFLPSEVVESLYAVVEKAGLEVASLTLEPIAALNAAIPADLRLLNLVLADIGAGTTDIAVCRDGTVVGYTMATIAGDEITEELMRRYLIPFSTAERMKTQLDEDIIVYRDVLGLEDRVSSAQLRETIQQPACMLAQEIAQRVIALNGAPPSALFLAGGGSKLEGLLGLVAEALDMDESRVALAGNNYEITAFSEEYELNDPELATPLGIAVSAGLGLISDSYRIMLNGQPAKLFRSGSLTLLELLMMNGYSSVDLLGRTGKNLSVTVNGQHMVFRGQPATPCSLTLNGAEGVPSALVYAGDSIEFIPAVQGAPAQRTLKDLLGADFVGGVMINGRMADLDTRLNTGDQIVTSDQPLRPAPPPPAPPRAAEPARRLPSPPPPKRPATPVVERPEPPASRPNPWERRPEPPRPAPERTEPPKPEPPRPEPPRPAEPPKPQGRGVQVILNGKALSLPGKGDGSPYYVMDLLEFSGIDFEHLDRGVELQVNGSECAFTQELRPQDDVIIRYLER
ncbi:cell division protein FtsA [Colidextribacter sp. OB.20]|uniref:cell division protein FtsA n=1 Tax=Colidextribacter sp. OB.20 TaxID=2304568 RepID=UPI00136BFA9C|nr:cell division FtsA domain-containing protein [Colidextribacter sp. OB.20]NBI11393.1 cell division protein FtsA [Colidextribacter sp. OB.20]